MHKHNPEDVLSLAAFGLLVRMRRIAAEADPKGFLKVGKKFLAPEDMLARDDRANLREILREFLDQELVAMEKFRRPHKRGGLQSDSRAA